MEKTLASFLDKVERDDFIGTSSILDDILADGQTSPFSKMLDGAIEQREVFDNYRLKVRDHIVDYLDCKGLYFALRIPSYSILHIVSEKHDSIKAKNWLTQYISLLNEYDDPVLDRSFIEIENLKDSRLVVLVPSILEKRQNELEECKIRYSVSLSGTKGRYSIKEILQTHYGRKIAVACNLDPLHPVISKTDFDRLKTAFEPFGLNIKRMMLEHSNEDLSRIMREEISVMTGAKFKSEELRMLYHTAIAHTQLGADNPDIVHNALTSITYSKTRFCNDAVARIVTSGSFREQIGAIRILEDSKDTSQIEFLSSMIPASSGNLRTALANAVSVLSSLAFSSSIDAPTKDAEEPRITTLSPQLMEEYSKLVARLFESKVLQVRVDAIRALATFIVPGMEDHLQRAMKDDDLRIRLAVLEVAERIPKEQAHGIISIALEDEDTSIVTKATSILESRWHDDFW